MTSPIAVFDLDGTLVHTAPDLVSSLNHALSKHGYMAADYSTLAPFAGTGGRGMLKQICGLRAIELSESEILPIIETFLIHYEANLPGSSTLYEGALELVKDLRQAGFKTAICTNKPQKLADQLLARLKIAQYFDAICGADYFAVRKPNPKHLTGTIELAGGDLAHAIMFGDSQTDFDTANAAGIPVIGVTFGYSPVAIDTFNLNKIISHYRELDIGSITEIIGL